MNKSRMIIYCIILISILVYVSIKPIKRLLSKEYFICRMNNIEKQIEYFNFPKLFKEGYILLHYTSLGRFYFYHPGKREFKNIAFIPEKELYFSDICFYFKGNCMSVMKFYSDMDSSSLTFIKETRYISTVRKKNHASTIFVPHLKEIQLYIIKNIDNQVIKKEIVESKIYTGYAKYNDEYYALIIPELKSGKLILIKQNKNNEIEEIGTLTSNTPSESNAISLSSMIIQNDYDNIYLCRNIICHRSTVSSQFYLLCKIDLEEKAITKCEKNSMSYKNCEFILNQGIREVKMLIKEGKFVIEGPKLYNIDREEWMPVGGWNEPSIILPWDTNISFDNKYIGITKSIKDIEDKENQIKSKDLCKLVRVEKYLYNLETKECEIVSFDTLVDAREKIKGALIEEEEFLRYEGFETIRGKVVNGKFVKIKRGK